MRRLALTLLVFLALTGSSAMASPRQIAPPGNAGVNQYLENVPAAGGNRPSASVHSSGVSSSPSASVRRSLAALAHLGGEGSRAAGAAKAGIPRRAKAGGGGSGENTGAAIARAVGGSDGGMGVILPVILVAVALAAALAVVVRKRRA
jgi:hypothetical protein